MRSTDGTKHTNAKVTGSFPYLGLPGGGYQTEPGHDRRRELMTRRSMENPHAGQGSVLLDIGDDIGALVVTMPRDLVGEEVEILPADQVGT